MVCLIAAYAGENRVIGKCGKIPWVLPEDMKHFKDLTMGHAVILGRKSYEEIGHPLPGRTTIVLTKKGISKVTGLLTADSLQEAIRLAGDQTVFLAGGESVYREGLMIADRLYLTEIHEEMEGDTFFPILPEGIFFETERTEHSGVLPFSYITLERI